MKANNYFGMHATGDQEFLETTGGAKLRSFDDSKASRIKVLKYNFNIENHDQWESNSDWLIDRVEKLYKVFSPRIKQINNHDNQFSIN